MRSVGLLAALSLVALAASGCGGGGGGGPPPPAAPPGIAAELDAFAPGAAAPGPLKNATVLVVDATSGASVANASVDINGVVLGYDAGSQEYSGSVPVAPGAPINLTVSVGSQRYTASTTQFTDFPSITAPASGAVLDTGAATTLTWTSGAPTSGANYALGALDVASPATGLVWPATRSALTESIGTTSYVIPPGSITPGNRLILVGLAAQVGIPKAATNSTFVIGAFGYVDVTVTGLPVTARASGTTSNLWGVTWNGSEFLAVGDNGTVLTSVDGATWARGSAGSAQSLSSVAWSGSQFVAVGSNGTVLTSPDGVAWMSQSSGTTALLYSVAWTGSQFIAVGGFNSTIITSPDGSHWTVQPTGLPDVFQGVAASPAEAVAVSRSGTILSSPDGQTWMQRASSGGYYGVTWSGAQFVAAGYASSPCCADSIATSPDGITWTPQSTGTAASPLAVTSSGGLFVAVGGSGVLGSMIDSADGVHWHQDATGVPNALQAVAASPTTIVMVGGRGEIVTSP